MADFDYILVGGGLQNGLLVSALRAHQPEARIALVEREVRLGGNHIWCFHGGDLSARARAWIEPLVTHRWHGYDVSFPNLRRRIDRSYSAITSERLHEVVSSHVEQPGSLLRLGHRADSITAHEVALDTGDRLRGALVVDGRGPPAPSKEVRAGYQRFLGLELELAGAHDLERPILMDARVDQSDGFRFFYVLPLGERRVLVEDTYFHDSPAVDRVASRAAINGYVARRGWQVARIAREESGVLPMPWSGRLEVPGAGPLIAGYAGGWFHPGTGYSLPVAARLADFVAGQPASRSLGPELERLARDHHKQSRYAWRLNGFLFRWFPPSARWNLFERFYRMPIETIERFYALQLRFGDRVRLMLGRPPAGLSLRYRMNKGNAR